MKNFGYCIWLTSSEKEKKNNTWNHYTNGFKSHITIKYNLTLQDSEKCLDFLLEQQKIKNKKYKIKLSDELFYEENEDEQFYCLYKKADLVDVDDIPEWFPLDAHVSFYYSYSPISKDIFEHIKEKIEENYGILDCFEIKLCDNHFLLW